MAENNRSGTYIVFEGVVACGKTTQSKMVMSDLKVEFPDREVLWTREPGGSEIADEIRRVVQVVEFSEPMTALCEQYLYAASRAQTLSTVVEPVLKRNGIVVSDRSFFTSIAFQGFGRGLGYETVMDVNRQAVGGLWPDKVVFMDLDLDVAMGRARDQMGDKFERLGRDFFEKAREGFLFAAEKFPDLFTTIDASGGFREVNKRIAQAVIGWCKINQ